MVGHVRQDKNSKKWLYSIEAGFNQNGKRKRIVKKGFRTKKEAKTAMALATNELKKEEINQITNNDITLGAYLDYWLKAYVQSSTSPNTFRGYEGIIRVHLLTGIGTIKLRDLTVQDVQNYYMEKLKIDSSENYAGLSAQTVKYHHRLLCKALNDAVDWEFINHNVALKAKAPKPVKF
ncbi:Arm DNA-binding domain-containing protein [Halalkalibacter nanhaiisediminis]|uniref:AP2-like DNA-binding integrase family protein n=1 Tax=Halalkalibacter nanhaiisediminis TaxID=688079 RepID=A0A562QRD9_9BACI|nr:Arm DNA-binding domain-containing protein [Halalkalibacter nanhaiisediminis]TWI59294.1 AP2-like DNA-binding integrase family protein [Halalkalibacter nanhaiisediminis]